MKPTKEEYIKIFSEMKKCRFLNELKLIDMTLL